MVSIEELEGMLTVKARVQGRGFNQHGLTGISRQYQWANQHFECANCKDMTPSQRLIAIDMRIRATKETIEYKKQLGHDTCTSESVLLRLQQLKRKVEYTI